MAVFKVALSLLKKQKTYVFAVFFLTLIVSVMLATSLTIIIKTGTICEDTLKKINCPDIMVLLMDDSEERNPEGYFKEKSDVKEVKISPYFFLNDNNTKLKRKDDKLPGVTLLFPYYNDLDNYTIISDKSGKFKLDDGEIMLLDGWGEKYDLKEGDTIKIFGKELKIAGFYKDSLLGSPLVSVERIFVNQNEWDSLSKNADERGEIVNVWVKGGVYADDYKDVKIRILEDFPFKEGMEQSFDILMFKQFLPMLSNIIAGVLAAFALLSFIVTLYVLRYAILSSVEGNFTTFGIYKAIGFKGKQIRTAILLQYVIICVIAVVVGVAASIPIIPIVGNTLISSMGIEWEGGLLISAGIITVIVLTAFVAWIAWLNSGKIKKISPVRAISHGRAPVYFAQRLNISLKKLSVFPLNLRMALKQIFSRRKQYTMLMIISVFMTFFIALTGGLASLFSDSDVVSYTFGAPKNVHLLIGSADDTREGLKELDDAIDYIKKNYNNVDKIFGTQGLTITLEDERVSALVYDSFEDLEIAPPITGSFPKHDNEVALSPGLANLLSKKIGDTVTVTNDDGDSLDYIVTGTVQSYIQVGMNFSVTTDAIKRLNPDFKMTSYSVAFKSDTYENAVYDELFNKYEDTSIVVSEADASTFDTIKVVLDILNVVSYVLAVTLIALITFLMTIIAVYRENTDISIFKSVGFKSAQVRSQFALRFLMVSFTGGLIGLVVTLLLSSPILSIIFQLFGLTHVEMEYTALQLLLPLIIVCVMALIASWLVSARIKKISGRNLIIE